ncbi:hypothetical protein [Flavobacterium cerinum]|uniref:Uncharacterized protein n=1 Tax=Flavobacterium cerinum TaxID=2502784 RepID=A0A3S3RL85_9FLAO|nr:hypothetical protein [Flavobacterium cerinum]RWX03380.1 hypothetical protein EPI11_00175 [Flavobacterium cerinum]
MTKDDWQKLKKTLSDYRSEFSDEYDKAKGGKNKQIRNNADRNVENIIYRTFSHIKKDNETFELLINSDDPIVRAETYNDFEKPHYFGRDLLEYINRIDEKIKEME